MKQCSQHFEWKTRTQLPQELRLNPLVSSKSCCCMDWLDNCIICSYHHIMICMVKITILCQNQCVHKSNVFIKTMFPYDYFPPYYHYFESFSQLFLGIFANFGFLWSCKCVYLFTSSNRNKSHLQDKEQYMAKYLGTMI